MKENSKPVSSVLQSKSVINKEIYGLKHKAKKKARRKMERMKETRAENMGEEQKPQLEDPSQLDLAGKKVDENSAREDRARKEEDHFPKKQLFG